MCGIAGIYHPGEGPDRWRGILASMNQDLFHRGPDEDGVFHGPDVSLGMRRLRVIDLETGSQPVTNEDGTVQLVLNGEIYRYESLRRRLETQGHRFKSSSDTEVLVHLYEQYGLSFFDQFDGMFAFALWDLKKERLLLARDRFGIKPLFYSLPEGGGRFAFASELRPLFRLPGLPKTMDPVALDQFFEFSYIPHPRSIYQSVKKLAPGHFLLAEGDRVTEHRYWDLDPSPVADDSQEAARAFDEALSASVKTMMRSDVPLGAFLSGGLDSSSVVYHMTRHASRPVQTFCVRFAEDTFDEGNQARLIARHLGTEHHELMARPEDVFRLEKMVAHFGEPFADPSQIPTFLVSELARQKVTVALSGDGGDEMLGGYETYNASLLAEHVGRIPRPLRQALLWMVNRMPVTMKQHLSVDYKLKKFLPACHLPPLERHVRWRTIMDPAVKRDLYSPAFAEWLEQKKGPSHSFSQWDHHFSGKSLDLLTACQYLDIKTYLIDNNLTKVDRMSMAHSLEVRIPFLDREVAERAFKIPPKDRARGLRTKIVLRRLMADRLPKAILTLPKRGFAVPLALWFQGPLRSWVDGVLSQDRLRESEILRPESVKRIVNAHQSGQANLSRQIWNLICFVQWHERSRAQGFL